MVNLPGDYWLGYRNCKEKQQPKSIHPGKLRPQHLLGRVEGLIRGREDDGPEKDDVQSLARLQTSQEMGKENLKYYCRKVDRKSAAEGLSPACLISSFCTSILKHEREGIANGLKLRMKPVVCALDFLTDKLHLYYKPTLDEHCWQKGDAKGRCIWKSTESSPWTTHPHSAPLQGETKDWETLESCQKHAEIAASPEVLVESVHLFVFPIELLNMHKSIVSLGQFPIYKRGQSCKAKSSFFVSTRNGTNDRTKLQEVPARVCRKSGYVKMQESWLFPLTHWCTPEVSNFRVFPARNTSITEWLALWEKDPVEILLDLGFGTEEPDVCTKIPPRFLSGASVAKGINIRVFLEAQKQRMDIERPNLYGKERYFGKRRNFSQERERERGNRDNQYEWMVDGDLREEGRELGGDESRERASEGRSLHSEGRSERFRQLGVLDHVTSALSSLLTNVNTQQTKAQDTGRDETGPLDAAKSRPVVTQVKRRRIGQLLKRASRQTTLLKQGSLVPGEASLPGKKEQPHSCADIAERGRVQAGFSTHVTLGCLTQEQTPRDKGASAYPTSWCPPTSSEKTCSSSHLVAKQPHLSPACEVPAKDRPRKEPPLLVAHMLKKVADLNCKLPDSFEMEEIQSFEDETPCGNAPDTTSVLMADIWRASRPMSSQGYVGTQGAAGSRALGEEREAAREDAKHAEVMVTRTSSCQSDSSGFMEELPEPVVLQNPSLSGKINFISDIHNQETALSHRTIFPMLNQDFQKKPDDCVAKVFITACESILTVPTSTKACSDQGEETHLLLTAENGKYQAYNAQPQTFVQEMLCDMDKKEDKTGRKQLEKEECIKEHSPCFQGDTQDEGDPSSSKFDHHLYFSTEHKKVNVTFIEPSDINPAGISESKIRGEDESERCLTEKDVGVPCHESAHQGCTGHVKGPWWGVEVVSKDGTLLSVNEVTNGQKFCKMEGDSKNTRCFRKKGLTETPQQGSAVQSGSSAASRCSLQVSQRHPSCLVEGPGLSSSEGQETGSIGEMLGDNKSEQGDTVQNGEMASAPLKSVTVQMPSGLEFTSKVKCTGQHAPVSESLAREDLVDFSDTLVHHSESGPLIWSVPGTSKDGVKQTMEASSQTDIHARKPRGPPLLHPPHSHLTKSASLDTVLCGKYRSHYWGEASGAGGAQGSCCCHCCCCHGCCPWTFPVGASPHRPVGCCSNRASTELQLLKTLTLLQDTAMHNLAPRTLHEIEAMKSSCQHFQEKLDEIEQHLTEQQVLFSSTMPGEGREEGRHLQLLRRAVRREVAELEFRLNDQACQVREGILMQLDQLLVEQSHLFSELGLSDWKGERKAQNKQAFPDAADTAHPQSGCSEMMLQRAPSKNTTATGSLSALQLGTPPTQFPTRTTTETNSAESDQLELSTSKKEIKGPPQAKMDFKAFLHNLKKSFQNSLEGKGECVSWFLKMPWDEPAILSGRGVVGESCYSPGQQKAMGSHKNTVPEEGDLEGQQREQGGEEALVLSPGFTAYPDKKTAVLSLPSSHDGHQGSDWASQLTRHRWGKLTVLPGGAFRAFNVLGTLQNRT
ncbi:hypothetical protein QYF61_014376 [Mycteria americana]|uniref:ITPR-interacting domain-containing protein n=1 Tax=Mycteria americana TaxID=33587 RepID=A0AAN7NG77_MYCAM|nr:hypothetical protein QYF61_014376 [Mycteria americana]